MVGYRQVKGTLLHGDDGRPPPQLRTENPVIQRFDPAYIIPPDDQITPSACQSGEKNGKQGVLIGKPDIHQAELPDMQGQKEKLADQGGHDSHRPPGRFEMVGNHLIPGGEYLRIRFDETRIMGINQEKFLLTHG